MSAPAGPPFEARLLADFHRLVPEVPVVLTAQPKRPSLFGVHAAQVSQQTGLAMDAALRTLGELWAPATGGLPAPATVRTEWRQQVGGYASQVVAVAVARQHGAPDRVRRLAGAHADLIAAGWATRRRDPRFPRYLRLLAIRDRGTADINVRARPDTYTVEVRYGPVLVGSFGAGLLALPGAAVPFPVVEP
jgi:hypothetical protein